MELEKRLDKLHPLFRPIVIEFLARLIEARIPVIIINTLRYEFQQKIMLENGVSWTKLSKHLLGLAIDICPYKQYDQYGPDKLQWNADDPVWQEIGEIAESLGLKWGVIKSDGTRIDLGHFEMMPLAA